MRITDDRVGTTVLGRAFTLLDVLREEAPGLGLAELARRARLPKATAFRLATQLVELKILERNGLEYRLGQKLFELGAGTRSQALRAVATPYLEDLYEAVHETVHLAVLNGTEVLYLDKISGRRRPSSTTEVGDRKPLHCTALGKAMLAFSGTELLATVVEQGLERRTRHTIAVPGLLHQQLARVRESGVAYDREEYALGVTCVASPLLDRSGRGRGAISVTGPTSRFHPERVAAAVRTTALGINRQWVGSTGHQESGSR
ncbi:IclR family transcriptional regulator [Streptomyces sp. VNUA24]|uniref:IclR family transcriptional regulator n=1 Tax=Streptomyces sp. VNUA24 TaxID=3031131 RepID=UPI0023B840DC|nr:IclR family transcriptional regulator [Streptomyces sp. VNUA24]WEH12928.1 IclR family transcriptional regulator [Streptomyces sp. VNUA24]